MMLQKNLDSVNEQNKTLKSISKPSVNDDQLVNQM